MKKFIEPEMILLNFTDEINLLAPSGGNIGETGGDAGYPDRNDITNLNP